MVVFKTKLMLWWQQLRILQAFVSTLYKWKSCRSTMYHLHVCNIKEDFTRCLNYPWHKIKVWNDFGDCNTTRLQSTKKQCIFLGFLLFLLWICFWWRFLMNTLGICIALLCYYKCSILFDIKELKNCLFFFGGKCSFLWAIKNVAILFWNGF
jgi:hypothetical protein